MKPPEPKIPEPTDSYTFELPYENDLDQDELNRRLRKPGEPGYRPPIKRAEVPDSPTPGAPESNGQGSQAE